MTASLDHPPPLAGADLSDVDRRISAAYGDLGRARSRFADEPSGESIQACVAAEDAVNGLLELRLSLTRS